MLNEDQIKGKWKEVRGGIRNLWGRLSDDELDQAKGNLTKITGLIQDKYGESKEAIKNKLDRLMDSFDNETDRSKQDLSTSSYQRNPTAESNVDAGFDDTNFSVGRDLGIDSESRSFNSSSPVMNSTSDFDDEGLEATDSYDSEEIFDTDEDRENFSSRSRGNLKEMNSNEDRIARH